MSTMPMPILKVRYISFHSTLPQDFSSRKISGTSQAEAFTSTDISSGNARGILS